MAQSFGALGHFSANPLSCSAQSLYLFCRIRNKPQVPRLVDLGDWPELKRSLDTIAIESPLQYAYERGADENVPSAQKEVPKNRQGLKLGAVPGKDRN